MDQPVNKHFKVFYSQGQKSKYLEQTHIDIFGDKARIYISLMPELKVLNSTIFYILSSLNL